MMKITRLLVAGLFACCGWCTVASAAIAVQTPQETDFNDGLGGWGKPISMVREARKNDAEDSFLIGMDRIKGNPGGFITAPDEYLGDWTGLDENGVLSFQYRRFSNGDAAFRTKPILVYLEGADGSRAVWRGKNVKKASPWFTVNVPIEEGRWVMQEGTWEGLLADVTELRIAVERVVNLRGRDERSAIDNITLNATNPAPVPEPGTAALLATGAVSLLVRRRRRGA
jgi:hypothetical protein